MYKSILIVDDDKRLRELLEDYFRLKEFLLKMKLLHVSVKFANINGEQLLFLKEKIH